MISFDNDFTYKSQYHGKSTMVLPCFWMIHQLFNSFALKQTQLCWIQFLRYDAMVNFNSTIVLLLPQYFGNVVESWYSWKFHMKTMVHEFSTIVYVKSTIVLPSMVLFYSKRWIFAYLPWFYNSFLYTFKKMYHAITIFFWIYTMVVLLWGVLYHSVFGHLLWYQSFIGIS